MLVLGFAGIYAVGTLVALAVWVVVGDRWWSQPVNLATFWWSLPAVPLALIALVARKPRVALLLAVPALTFVWAYGGAFLPHTTPDVAAEVRVGSYNTFVNAPDASHVISLVRNQDLDVVLLQEVFPEREETLTRALGERMPHRWVGTNRSIGAVAVYSRFPITDVREIEPATDRSRRTAVVTLDVDGRALQVVPMHLISPCPSCGPSLTQRVEFEGDARRAEVTAVLAALDPEVPAIVGGDLNSNDRAEPYRLLVGDGFRDPQRDVGDGPGFTWPVSSRVGPVIRIDWLLTRGMESLRAEVAPAAASDHRAVIADLRFAS